MSTSISTRDTAMDVTIPFPTPEELYKEYGGDDGIDRDEFAVMLGNIDGFGNVAMDCRRTSDRIQEYVDAEFEAADLNHDGVIDADEFNLYYFKEICFKFPVGKNGYNPGATLYNIFCNYCSYGKGGKRCEEMESHQLLKLCRDCGLLTKVKCRKADIDLVFHRSRAETVYARMKGAAKLQYKQFLHALMLIAEKRQSGFCEVTERIRRYGSVHRAASMADFLVMHDPLGLAEDVRDLERPRGLPQLRRNATGPTFRPASSNPQRSPGSWEATLMRMPCAADGIKAGCADESQVHAGSSNTAQAAQGVNVAHCPGAQGVQWAEAAEPNITAAVHGGTGTLHGDTRPHLTHCEDLNRAVNVVGQGKQRKKWDFDSMARSFYDDPENSRVTAVIASPCKATLLRRAAGTTRRSGASRTAVFQDSEAMHCVRLAKEERLTMALKYVFEQFNKWEGGVNSSRMDKMRFHKVLREVGILRPGSINPDVADSVFAKIKPEAQPSINFVQFLEGLRHCAMLTRMSLNEVVQRIVALGGPVEILHK